MYELFDHTADLGLLVRADTREQLLIDAAAGLNAMILAPGQQLAERETRSLTLAAEAMDSLLFDWLSELLFLFETEHFLCAQIRLNLSDAVVGLELSAKLIGEVIDINRFRLEHEVKAITYHELEVAQVLGMPDDTDRPEPGWQATVIVDI